MANRRTVILIAALCVALVSLQGCATLLGGRRQRIEFDGVPDGTAVTVTDSTNAVVFEGTPPMSVKLLRNQTFARAARYVVAFQHPDYATRYVVLEPRKRTGAIAASWYLGAFWGVSPIVDFFAGSNIRFDPRRIDSIEFVPIEEGAE